MESTLQPGFGLVEQLRGLAARQQPQYTRPVDIAATIVPKYVDEVSQYKGPEGLIGLASMATPPQERSVIDPRKYSGIWKNYFNTKKGKGDEGTFVSDFDRLNGKAPQEKAIWDASNKVMPAFSGEMARKGISTEDMGNLMYATAVHESLGGEYNKQLDGGPARSWWQIEPKTAYDNIQNFGHAMGPAYEKATGHNGAKLKGMTQEQVGTLLETDPKFAASMAQLWYLRRMPDKK